MRVALVGNPNSGKSTLFNTLTGANQKIGNWPGVTIEKKSGIVKNTKFEVIDLPGIYSLNTYTKEEEVASNFIYKEDIDIYINVIDCNSISRGLYLTTQLLELNKKIIIALNMYDIAENKGVCINENKLSQALDRIDIVKISAITGEGIQELVNKLKIISDNKTANNSMIYNKNINSYVDEKFCERNNNKMEDKTFQSNVEKKYKYIDNILTNSLILKEKRNETLTDKLDKIFLNKIFAVPIFAIIMFFIYYAAIDLAGRYTADFISNVFDNFSHAIMTYLSKNVVNEQLISLLTKGIINGITSVISFLPQLIVLFIAISFLEKCGYMSRCSFIFDKLFKKLGLSGQSVIPFIIGTGCSVPAIMATRIIKNERERKLTAVLTPFIPCSAKLPIISLFSTYFFVDKSSSIAFSFYVLAIFVIIVSSLLLKRKYKLNDEISYMSELPEYRIPRFKHIIKDSLDRVWDFIKRAGSIIFISSIIIWMLLSYSLKINFRNGINSVVELKSTSNIEESILANVGKTFSWIFIPMVGENSWEIAVSSIQGLIAKEQVVSSMSIISGLKTKDALNNIFVKNQGSPFGFFNGASAYAYVCFNLFSAPCFGAIGAMKKALGGTKNMLKAVGYQIGISYIISCIIFNFGNFICM